MTIPPEFKRKNLRLPPGRYRGRNLYFVTLCFHDRRRLAVNPRLASWLIASLRKHAAVCAFFIHAYCVMPDHIHLLAAGGSDESNLIKFVEALKQETAVEFARRTHRRLWQFKYYDSILRASDALDRVAWYIWMNPVRKGLCRTPTDYSFLGSFTQVGTKLLRSAFVTPWSPPWSRTKFEECRAKDRGATLKS
jgi:putative transposase